MRSAIERIWDQLRLLWRPALVLCVALLLLESCRHWDPVAEKVIEPAPTSPPRTAPPQSRHQEHNLAARSG